MRIKSLSIRTKIILASFVTVVIAMVALTLVNLHSVRGSVRDLVSAQTGTIADSNAREIASWVKNKETILQSLQPAIGSGDAQSYLFQAQTSGGFMHVYYADTDKTMHFSEPVDLPSDYDPTTRSWYKNAVSTDGVTISEPYTDAASGSLVISLSYAVKKGGSLRAVVSSDIRLDDVIEGIRGLRPTEHSFAYLVSGDGKIIAHPDADLSLKPATAVVASYDGDKLKALAGSKDDLAQVTYHKQAYWLVAHPVKGTDWTLVVALNQGDVMAGVRHMRTQSIVTTIVMVVLAAILLAILTRLLLRRLGLLGRALEDISSGEGDLTQRLDQHGGDELSQVGAAFNLFVDKIAGTLRRIRDTVDSVHVASNEIATGNNDLAQRTDNEAASLQETSSSIEEIASTVKQTAESSNTAVSIVNGARDAASEGGDLMKQVFESMQALNENSVKVNDIIGLIDTIAFQTNILALNASVEAARAGEHGRGFAVVASEVRALAQRSADSASEIKALIETNVEQVARSDKQVHKAGETMERIVSEVQRAVDIISEIKVATNEQSLGIGQIEEAIQQLDGSIQQNAALVQESAAAADSLRQQAKVLAQAVGQFKLDRSSVERNHKLEAIEKPKGAKKAATLPSPESGGVSKK